MPRYSLDSDTCITHLRSRGMSAVSQRLLATVPRQIVICSVLRSELLYGAYRSKQPQFAVAEMERFYQPFRSARMDNRAADAAARLRAELMKQNQQIGPYDSLIAAIALVRGHVLVTGNVREFSRVPGLRWENWK